MSDFPKFIEIHEEGPREGFQIEPRVHPIERRIELINALSETGLKYIQVGSFVNPKKVPTMADTPELFERITKKDGVNYVGLWLNKKGFLRALDVPGISLRGDLMFYASDALAHSNNDRSAAQMRDEQLDFVRLYEEHNVPIKSAYIMCAFGCNMEGEIPLSRITDLLPYIKEITVGRGHPLPTIYLADTMGWGNPEDFKRRIGAVRDILPEARIGTHIHDTRGLGIANFYAALEMGAESFDSCIGGLGGCPFASHKNRRAAGNVCTEDAVFMCNEMGIETGVDLDKLVTASLMAEEIVGGPLSGKIMHSGSLSEYRHKAAAE